MKSGSINRHIPAKSGGRFTFPAALLGSLLAIALMLYAVDTEPVRALLAMP